MKKLIAAMTAFAMLLCGCSSNVSEADASSTTITAIEAKMNQSDEDENSIYLDENSFAELEDELLLDYVENQVYDQVVSVLDTDNYYVECVNAVYYSQEYIDTLMGNSQPNVYFGYTMNELNDIFGDERYVFTLDDNGKTTVQPLEEIPNTDGDTIIKNVAVGTGVIVVCVVISTVAPAVGAPAAFSAIMTASASGATTMAISSAAIGGLGAGIIRGYQTGDYREAFKAAALQGSEDFKIGAISGAVIGGAQEALILKVGTKAGLTMSEVAKIQKESGWPIEMIKKLHSVDEFAIYKKAGLTPIKLADGKLAMVREIDWKRVDSFGRTNVERVREWGLAPIDSSGNPFELHHIGQRADSPLAILTQSEHRLDGNSKILHYAKEGKNVADNVWLKQKQDFWKQILELAEKAGKIN